MMSKDLDSYLRLEDGAGKELARDDDSGGNLNARIMFNCPKDGAYRLICTTFGGGIGSFTLTIQQSGLAKAAELTLKDGLAQVEAQLTATDAKDAVQTNSFCKIYAVKLAKGKVYQIDMMSKNLDSYLRLEDGAGKELAKDDDSGGNLNARIMFKCPADGAYRLICTTFGGGGTGPFTLTIKQAEAAKAAELILKDGLAQVEAQLTATDAKDAKQTNSFCKIYAVKLAKGKAYLIDMMSKDVDSFLRLENSAGKELAKDDDSGGGHDARIQFTCPEDGEYRIVATTFFSGTGAFTLTVKEN